MDEVERLREALRRLERDYAEDCEYYDDAQPRRMCGWCEAILLEQPHRPYCPFAVLTNPRHPLAEPAGAP